MKSQANASSQEAEKVLVQMDLVNRLQISELRNQELQDQLHALQERFSYMLKATQDAVWDWDLTKNVGWYSDGIKTLFGYDPAEIMDAVIFWHTSIHPEDKERVIKGIHAVIDNGGKNWNDQYRFKKADGTYAWVLDRGYAIQNTEGKSIRMVGSMQDITREVETRDALRESEEKFRATFDQAAVGISIATPRGEFLLVNKAYPKIFGYTHEELRSKTFSDLSHPDEIEGDKKIMQELLAGRTQLVAREKRYIHKSGRILWARVFGTIVYDSSNAPKYIVGVLEDITEQHTALAALKENEERLRLVIDSAQIGTWDFDPRTGKLHWDTRCKALFGMHPDDHADYEVFLQRLHPDDREAADKANRDAINGIGDGEYDLEYRTIGLRDQKLRWLRAKGRSYKDADGVTYRYAGTVIDITDKKEKEQRLREQEQRFRLLATSIPQIVWTTDEHGIVDYISDKWELYTGQKPNYDKFSFRELMHPEDLATVVNEWGECMQKGITFATEYRLLNVNTGEYRWFNGSIAPLKNESGAVIKWIGSATDIHDQKMIHHQLENKVLERTKELTTLNHRLEKSNSELEQYAYITSHDLKEPLRKIQTYNNLITAKFSKELSPEVIQYVDKIDSAAARMSGLIEDLLKYSRLSNDSLRLEDVDLNDIVQHIRTDFEHALEEKNIAVDTTGLPVVHGISIQMHQLFSNLFSNAIKFSKPGIPNIIRIKCFALPEDERLKHSSLNKQVPYYKIIFQDEGIGFSNEYSEQIFTIFQRLNNRNEYEGYGIGLALCRKIVNKHQGIIWANGEKGKGAEFTIILPSLDH